MQLDAILQMLRKKSWIILLGAILALPVAAAARDILRYLFRRLTPDAPEPLAASLRGLGLERHPGLPEHPANSGVP